MGAFTLAPNLKRANTGGSYLDASVPVFVISDARSLLPANCCSQSSKDNLIEREQLPSIVDLKL